MSLIRSSVVRKSGLRSSVLLALCSVNAFQVASAQETPTVPVAPAPTTPTQATPTQATPTQATPTQATPAQTTPAQASPTVPGTGMSGVTVLDNRVSPPPPGFAAISGAATPGTTTPPPRLTIAPSVLHRTGSATYVTFKASIPLDSERGSAIGKLARNRDLISLTVKDATLSTFVQKAVAQRYKYMPPLRVDVRSNSPLRISCSFENTNILEAISSIARLANCRLFLMEDSLLVAPVSALTKEEKLVAVDYASLFSPVLRDGIRTVADTEAFQTPEQLAREIKMQQRSAVQERLVNSELLGKTDQPWSALSPDLRQTVQDFANLIGAPSTLGNGTLVTVLQNDKGGTQIRITYPGTGEVNRTVPPASSIKKG